MWQDPILMVPTSMRGADGVDGTTLKWLLKFAFMKKQREEAKKRGGGEGEGGDGGAHVGAQQASP